MFSLQELERMEEERIRALADAERREHAMRESARREEVEGERIERRAREQAEDEARRDVERRAREEAARIEAIRRATMDAAHLEAQARTRAEQRELERRHELELERARGATGGTKARMTVLAALFGAVVAAGMAMAVHFGVVAPREHARAIQAESAIASREVAIADLRSHTNATDAQVRALQDDLAAARTEEDRLRTDLDVVRRQGTLRAPAPRRTGPATRADPKLDGFTSCPPGSKDPMCLR